MNDYFLTRTTIRKYTDTPVSDELLNRMLLEASHAPTTGNMQLYSVIVTRDADKKKALAPTHFGQPQVVGAPVVLTFCADFNRFVRWCETSEATPGYDNLQSLVTAALDTAIFAQQFCTIAELNGLGTCYLGTTTYNSPDIAKILNLPKRVVPLLTVTVGYPAEEGVETGRLPVEAIMHNETYCDYTDQEIKRLYAEKESREDSAGFVAENKKHTLAQVFTDVRYTREANETFSKILYDFIIEQYPMK